MRMNLPCGRNYSIGMSHIEQHWHLKKHNFHIKYKTTTFIISQLTQTSTFHTSMTPGNTWITLPHYNSRNVYPWGKITHKSRWVVVFDGLGVTKSLQNGISLQQLFLQLSLVMIVSHENIIKSSFHVTRVNRLLKKSQKYTITVQLITYKAFVLLRHIYKPGSPICRKMGLDGLHCGIEDNFTMCQWRVEGNKWELVWREGFLRHTSGFQSYFKPHINGPQGLTRLRMRAMSDQIKGPVLSARDTVMYVWYIRHAPSTETMACLKPLYKTHLISIFPWVWFAE